jgi:hypothetical protein
VRRRNFLLGLLAAPLAPLAAKLLPKAAPLTFHGIPVHVGRVGSDQTSIWFIEWGKNHATSENPLIANLPYGAPVPKGQINWLKRSIRGD